MPSSASSRESGKALHQRETRRQIWLPFGLAALVIAGMFLMAALLNDPLARARVAIIADFMFMLLVLCPSILCLFVVYLLVVMAMYGMHRLHHSVGTPLERLERATETMAERMDAWTDALNRRVVNLSVRFAPLMAFLSLFDTHQETQHGESEPPAKSDQSDSS